MRQTYLAVRENEKLAAAYLRETATVLLINGQLATVVKYY